jgi:hypothetical protein
MLPDDYIRKMKQDLAESDALVESRTRCEPDPDSAVHPKPRTSGVPPLRRCTRLPLGAARAPVTPWGEPSSESLYEPDSDFSPPDDDRPPCARPDSHHKDTKAQRDQWVPIPTTRRNGDTILIRLRSASSSGQAPISGRFGRKEGHFLIRSASRGWQLQAQAGPTDGRMLGARKSAGRPEGRPGFGKRS